MKFRHAGLLLAFPFLLLGVGTTGYVAIERWSVTDALYMTVITVTTLGFGEVHPLSAAGRWFTMALALGGIFTFFAAASSVIALAVSGELLRMLRRLKMERALAGLSSHVIVCGSGRMGRLVARALLRQKLPVVLIDRDPAVFASPEVEGALTVQGDACADDLLVRVGIGRARALVAALGSDADNVFLTLGARALSPALLIVARSVEELTESKLVRAGANRVVSPFSVGGYVAANAILHPTVIDSVDLAQRAGHLEVQIEEFPLARSCSLCDRPLKELRLREELGVLLVALRRAGGETLFDPPDTTTPAANDTLVAMGRRENLDRLERLTAARSSPP